MQRIWLFLLLLVLPLSGCGGLLTQEYESVTPHVEQAAVEEDENALTAQNYLSLKNAILSFVQNGVESGVIRAQDYSGDVEKDLAAAAYAVSKQDPLGAYAVDYMTHDCAQIVSYYEIHINITFRRGIEQIRSIRRAGNTAVLAELLNQTMSAYGQELTARLSYYDGQDLSALIRDYYDANPATAMELPEVTINLYPDSGNVRIVELLFEYSDSAAELLEKQDAVATSVRAAGEYVRYRNTEADKLQLLYTYLQERFSYRQARSATPVYSFLCEGVVSDSGCARSLQVICGQMGVECYTVSGNRSGEAYSWNIICVDGRYCHVDLARALLEAADRLPLYDDEALSDYYWNAGQYPACPPPQPEEPEAGEEPGPSAPHIPDTAPEPEAPSEETPEEPEETTGTEEPEEPADLEETSEPEPEQAPA